MDARAAEERSTMPAHGAAEDREVAEGAPGELLPPPQVDLPTWEPSGTGGPTRSWVAQALTGVGLLALVTIHMIAHHFIVPEGLRNFADVIEYLSNPVIVGIEVTFLVVVTWHGLLGVRAILFDFGFSPATERRISRVLLLLGVATVAYGLWLTSVIVSYR